MNEEQQKVLEAHQGFLNAINELLDKQSITILEMTRTIKRLNDKIKVLEQDVTELKLYRS